MLQLEWGRTAKSCSAVNGPPRTSLRQMLGTRGAGLLAGLILKPGLYNGGWAGLYVPSMRGAIQLLHFL